MLSTVELEYVTSYVAGFVGDSDAQGPYAEERYLGSRALLMFELVYVKPVARVCSVDFTGNLHTRIDRSPNKRTAH